MAIRHAQYSFSFVVADPNGFTEFALHLSPDILEHFAVCMGEVQRHHDQIKPKKKLARAVLPFRKRKRSA
jgi:hypothetical protein